MIIIIMMIIIVIVVYMYIYIYIYIYNKEKVLDLRDNDLCLALRQYRRRARNLTVSFHDFKSQISN